MTRSTDPDLDPIRGVDRIEGLPDRSGANTGHIFAEVDDQMNKNYFFAASISMQSTEIPKS
jgi:hypothetical protein